MKATILLLLSAMLGFAEPAAPGGASSPSEPPAAFAESRPSAEPAPARKHAKPVKVNGANGANGANGVNDVNRANPGKPRLGATATLSDGSVLKGTLRRRFLPADTRPLGRIRLDLRAVASIDATAPQGGTPARYRVAFKNGDRLTVRFPADLKPLRFDTVLGRVFLPLTAVSSLALDPHPTTHPPNHLTTQPPSLLYHCTFDDAHSIERPVAGPSGTFLGGTFEEGKAGNALRVRKGLSSAIVHFGKGTIQPRGTIEFWAKIENDREHFGDGGDPRFFMMETAPGSETVFQLAANDGCGRGGLSIYHQGLSVASEDHCLYPAAYNSILHSGAKGWHHYVLVWDENGVPGLDGPVALAAFIDGKRIPLHGDTGLAKAPRMASRLRDNPATLFFSLNPELDRGFNNKTDFLIDEFKIWSVAKPPREAI